MTDPLTTPNIPNIPMTITVPDQATYELFKSLAWNQRLLRQLSAELRDEAKAFDERQKDAFSRGAFPTPPVHVANQVREIEKATSRARSTAALLRALPNTGHLVDKVLSRPAGVDLHVEVDPR